MALTRQEIKEAYDLSDIVITDYNEDQLNNASYNIRLGSNFFRMEKLTTIMNPFAAEEVSNLWEKGQLDDDGDIIISPSETVLCHSEEFIGSVRRSVPMLKSRSTVMRAGLEIAAGAGWGDVGFTNRWGFTVRNNGPNKVCLKPGCQIAQMVFLRVNRDVNSYEGQYQAITNLEIIQQTWKPENLLPRIK